MDAVKPFGGQSMTARLRRVLVRRPDGEFQVEDPRPWNYSQIPDLALACREHDELVQILAGQGILVEYHREPAAGLADAIYVYDPLLMTNEGGVVLRMGKDLRAGEEAPIEEALRRLDIPILGHIVADGTAEGGDLLWLDSGTIVAGVGLRTNQEGVRQLRQLLRPLGVKIHTVDLPRPENPNSCLHLLSVISPLDETLAVVFPPLLPTGLSELLFQRGFELVQVPEEEFESMATNVLALAPRECLTLEGNPRTEARLRKAGCSVKTYRGSQISHVAEGGPTCLTQPLWRE